MNENLELMMSLYKTSEMGVYSTTCLINTLRNKENKIKPLLESEIKEYEKYKNKSEKILNKKDLELPNNSLMTKMSSNMGIKMEAIMDNSDSAIASMLIEGFTMGILEAKSKIEKYKGVCDNKYLKIYKDFLKFQEKEIKHLKTFI